MKALAGLPLATGLLLAATLTVGCGDGSDTTAPPNPTTTADGGGGSGASTSTGGTGGSGASTSTGGGGTGGTGGVVGGGGTGGSGGSGGGVVGGGGTGGSGGSGGCVDAGDCNDSVACTVDSCDQGVCSNTTDDAQCDNGDFCDGAETCDLQNGDPQTGCLDGTDPCDDSASCSVDTCDEGTDTCTNAVDDAQCDNGDFCDGAETCDPQNGDPQTGCLDGTNPCEDSVDCTADSCDEGTDTCTNAVDDAQCDNGDFCDGAETCDPQNGDPQTGCLDSVNPCDDSITCTVDSCDEGADTCTNAPSNAACDDLQYCTGVETCDPQNGDPLTGCVAGDVITCDDLVPCTTDFCDDNIDDCQFVADDNECANGDFCDGAEYCDPLNGDPQTGCSPGTLVDCDDLVGCTVDTCNEGTDQCDYTPDDGACDNGQFCDGAEYCDVANDCQSSSPIACGDGVGCTIDSCDEVGDVCVNLENDQACDDGLWCNGVETCDSDNGDPLSGCMNPPDVDCDDGIDCTDDSCDDLGDICVNQPNHGICPGGWCVPADPFNGCAPEQPCTIDAECDDDDVCNGVETCNVVCQAGTALDCIDAVGCTIDSCHPTLGCQNSPNDALCEDGLACNGIWSCDIDLDCVEDSPAADCDDGWACTIDQCLEPSGTCYNPADDTYCGNGVFCDGVESCDPLDGDADADGCVLGSPPSCEDSVDCTVDTCDPNFDYCTHVPDNSLCACGESCDPQDGCGNWCIVHACSGPQVYACGNCIDDDGDCEIDDYDSECLGPCDDTEDAFWIGIPGANKGGDCEHDCYFDNDSGIGNDNCYWTHECDPYGDPTNPDPEAGSPYWPPGGEDNQGNANCPYDPTTTYGGLTCDEMMQDSPSLQPQECSDMCLPITPNGCDCWGCCEIPDQSDPNTLYTVFLGSNADNNSGTCGLDELADEAACLRCTQVPSCLNECGECEICVGKPTLPPHCLCQYCPPGVQTCGPPCGTPCPVGFFCNTGCCAPLPGS